MRHNRKNLAKYHLDKLRFLVHNVNIPEM